MAQHLAQLLDDLKDRVFRLGASVLQVTEQAVESVLRADASLASQVVAEDDRIDEEEVRIEKKCIDLLALHAPTAGDLRVVTTLIKINSDLERVADCAVNIAQRVPPLAQASDPRLPADLRLLAGAVLEQLRRTIASVRLDDEQEATAVLAGDNRIDALYQQIVQDMLLRMESDGVKANLDLSHIMIAKNLERIGDHCTNIAEDVIFIHSGRIVRHQK